MKMLVKFSEMKGVWALDVRSQNPILHTNKITPCPITVSVMQNRDNRWSNFFNT